MEVLNHSIRRPVELTTRLGLEPFATLPYIRTPGEVRRKRLIVAGTLVAIAVAIPAILFAIQTYYMPLDLLTDQILAKVGISSDIAGTIPVTVPAENPAPAVPAAAPAKVP
jgi:hypothetical protein